MTVLNTEGGGGIGGGEGVGAALQGSRPSYAATARGLSSTKLPPNPLFGVAMYRCPGRGELNMVAC